MTEFLASPLTSHTCQRILSERKIEPREREREREREHCEKIETNTGCMCSLNQLFDKLCCYAIKKRIFQVLTKIVIIKGVS